MLVNGHFELLFYFENWLLEKFAFQIANNVSLKKIKRWSFILCDLIVFAKLDLLLGLLNIIYIFLYQIKNVDLMVMKQVFFSFSALKATQNVTHYN